MNAYIIVTGGGSTNDDFGDPVENLQVLAVMQARTELEALTLWKDRNQEEARAFSKSTALIYELKSVCPVTLPIITDEEQEAVPPWDHDEPGGGGR